MRSAITIASCSRGSTGDRIAKRATVDRVFGDRVDGTFLGLDPTHAHMNMPAVVMWARGLEDRPVRLALEPPSGTRWAPIRMRCRRA